MIFMFQQFLEPEVFDTTFDEGVDKHLGDIVICPSYIARTMISDEVCNVLKLIFLRN